MINPGELERKFDDSEGRKTIVERMRGIISATPGYLANAFVERSRTREIKPPIIGLAVKYVQARFPDRSEVEQAALREAFIAGNTFSQVASEAEKFDALITQLPDMPDFPDAA